MAKKKGSIVYKCSSCGYTQPGWLGRCPQCGEWNTLEECITDPNAATPTLSGGTAVKVRPVPLAKIAVQGEGRITTGIEEFDRVLGGGATLRSAVLIGGEPGIGKSTLLLQSAASVLKAHKGRILYVSGEESASQIKGRATRLALDVGQVEILCTLRLEDILDALDSLTPSLVIIDSIQTVYSVQAGIVPGTVAGPKSLEHMVDTVISFERNNNDDLRFLHALKNRFGSVDELGVFKMEQDGLKMVDDPSTLFITKREKGLPAGVSCVPVFEGSRVFVVEIQALTVGAKGAINRVYSDRIDSARVSRVAAVIEKCAGIKFSDVDIYINVAGGARLSESAIDAALAAALYSARTDIALPERTAIVGELSLAGEIRPVAKLKERVKAAKEMGFTTVLTPEKSAGATAVSDISALVRALFSNTLDGKTTVRKSIIRNPAARVDVS